MPSTKDCPTREWLRNYFLGKMPVSEAEGIDQHIETCEDCLATLVNIEKTDKGDSVIQELRNPSPPSPFRDEPGLKKALAWAAANPPADVKHPTKAEVDASPPESPETPAQPPQVPGLAKFEHDLVDCGAMTAEQLTQFKAKLPKTPAIREAMDLAVALVQNKRLTKYQAGALYKGDAKQLVLGGYLLVDELGAGGMGKVYRARHRESGEPAAVKVLGREHLDSKKAVRRFQREARATAKLSHPNIVRTLDAGEHEGRHYLAVELIDGQDLADVIKQRGPVTVRGAARVIRQAAEALQYAHAQGIIHRDVKPHNLLVDTRGHVKLLDLGLALFRQGDDSSGTNDSEQTELTGMYQVMGTADFMSPEQSRSTHTADERADIYSLGATLYHLLVGESMYPDGDHFQKIYSHRARPIPTLRARRLDVPEEFDVLYQTMVAKSPSDRFQTMSEFLAALATTDLPPKGTRPHLIPQADTNTNADAPIPPPTPSSPAGPAVSMILPSVPSEPPPAPVADLPDFFQNLTSTKPARSPAAPKPRPKPQSQSKKLLTHPRTLLSIALGLVGIVLMAALAMVINDDDGRATLTIERPSKPDTLEVLVIQDGVAIETIDESNDWSIPLDDGNYTLAVKSNEDNAPVPRLAQTQVTITNAEPIKIAWTSALPPSPPLAIAPFDAEEAKKHQEAWAKHLGVPIEFTNSIGMKFILIPPGEFMMGSSDSEIAVLRKMARQDKASGHFLDRLGTESPSHRVRLTEPFYLSMYEVTQAQYKEIAGKNPSRFQESGRDLPVEEVSIRDVYAYCDALNEREEEHALSRTYWLPYEAQWEYACRAGTTSWYSYGNDLDLLNEHGWYSRNSQGHSHPVGKRTPNAWGLHDMHGNVREWCRDYFSDHYYRESSIDNPTGPSRGAFRTMRGGHWESTALDSRSAQRGRMYAHKHEAWVGFRLVCKVPLRRDGLKTEYFSGCNFDKKVAEQVERQIAWPLGTDESILGLPIEDFSVRWSGWIKAPQVGRYWFIIRADDGARLWIDGTLVIDRWKRQARGAGYHGEITLTDEPHQIKVEYCQAKGNAGLSLNWLQPGLTVTQAVPKEVLFETREAADVAKVSPDLLRAAPPEPPSSTKEQVDLLVTVHPHVDLLAGSWYFDSRGLVGRSGSVLRLPYVPPREYVVVAEFERLGGTNGVTLGLTGEDSRFCAQLDHSLNGQWVTRVTKTKPDQPAEKTTTLPVPMIPVGKTVTVTCRVSTTEVVVEADGQIVAHWKGSPEQLTLDNTELLFDKLGAPETPELFLQTSATFRVTRLELHPKSGPAKWAGRPNAKIVAIADMWAGGSDYWGQRSFFSNGRKDTPFRPTKWDVQGDNLYIRFPDGMVDTSQLSSKGDSWKGRNKIGVPVRGKCVIGGFREGT